MASVKNRIWYLLMEEKISVENTAKGKKIFSRFFWISAVVSTLVSFYFFLRVVQNPSFSHPISYQQQSFVREYLSVLIVVSIVTIAGYSALFFKNVDTKEYFSSFANDFKTLQHRTTYSRIVFSNRFSIFAFMTFFCTYSPFFTLTI